MKFKTYLGQDIGTVNFGSTLLKFYPKENKIKIKWFLLDKEYLIKPKKDLNEISNMFYLYFNKIIFKYKVKNLILERYQARIRSGNIEPANIMIGIEYACCYNNNIQIAGYTASTWKNYCKKQKVNLELLYKTAKEVSKNINQFRKKYKVKDKFPNIEPHHIDSLFMVLYHIEKENKKMSIYNIYLDLLNYFYSVIENKKYKMKYIKKLTILS